MSAPKFRLECGKSIEAKPGGRSTRKFCRDDPSCKTTYDNRKRDERKREEAELEPIKGLLQHIGDEEREHELLLEGFAKERKRMTGKPRECRCNGSGVYDYDQDGDPYCRLCGGPVRAIRRDPSRGSFSVVWSIGREGAGGRPRDLSEEWARARRAGEPAPELKIDNRCKVYKGRPFHPEGRVVLR